MFYFAQDPTPLYVMLYVLQADDKLDLGTFRKSSLAINVIVDTFQL